MTTHQLLDEARKNIESAQIQSDNHEHFESAYGRALDYAAVMHYPALPSKSGDDPFFTSPDGNCCAVDVLIAELEKVRETKP